MTFTAIEGHSSSASEKSFRCTCNPSLLCPIDIILWWRLYAFPAGLYLYKMYSIRADGNNIYLKMSGSPVPFDDGMTDLCQISAGQFLSNLP